MEVRIGCEKTTNTFREFVRGREGYVCTAKREKGFHFYETYERESDPRGPYLYVSRSSSNYICLSTGSVVIASGTMTKHPGMIDAEGSGSMWECALASIDFKKENIEKGVKYEVEMQDDTKVQGEEDKDATKQDKGNKVMSIQQMSSILIKNTGPEVEGEEREEEENFNGIPPPTLTTTHPLVPPAHQKWRHQ